MQCGMRSIRGGSFGKCVKLPQWISVKYDNSDTDPQAFDFNMGNVLACG